MWPFKSSRLTLQEAIAAELADGDADVLPTGDTFREELAKDPRGYGYAAAVERGDDPALAEMLNRIRDEIQIKVPVSQRGLLKTLAARTKLKSLKLAADNGNEAAWNTWEILQHPAFASGVDLFDPISRGMLTALVGSGVLSAEDRTALEALGLRSGSRAEELSYAGVVVTPEDAGGLR